MRGVHTCGSGGDNNVQGGKDTDSGRGGYSVAFNDGFDFEDGLVGKNESDFFFNFIDELFEFGDDTTEFSEFVVFRSGGKTFGSPG